MTSIGRFPPTSCRKCEDCDRPGETYHGFPLKNHMDNYHYMGVASTEDCRTLCKLAEDCNFFVHQSNEQKCSLKYGIGEKKKTDQSSNYIFGSKNCSGERTGRDLSDAPKSGEPLSAAVPALAGSSGGLLLVVIAIVAIVCLRCRRIFHLYLIISISAIEQKH